MLNKCRCEEKVKSGRKPKQLKDRLLSRIEIDATTQCWNYTGFLNDGYGHITVKRNGEYKTIGAHRLSFEIFKRSIAAGLYVLHKCDNRRCVNPDHLFLGTHMDNMIDGVLKKRFRYGENHHLTKLTAKMVRVIKESKEPAKVLSIQLGVPLHCVYDVRRGKSWGWY